MKKYICSTLALVGVLACNPMHILAQQPISPIANQTQTTQQNNLSATPTYGEIQSLAYDTQNRITSITIKDKNAHTIVYQIDTQTAFLDSGNKTKASPATLKQGDTVYIYHTQDTATAIITNIPMDTAVAHLYTIEHLAIHEDGTVTITSAQGQVLLTTDTDTVITSYDTTATLQVSDLQIGQSFFTWYDITTASEPTQTTIGHIMILPETQEKTQVVYQKNILPVVNGVYCVPLRETADKLGLTTTWDSKHHIAKLESDTRTMNLILGNDTYISSTKIKGAVGMTAPQKLGVAPFIDKNNTMYVPANIFSVLVGYDVTITEQSVTITEHTNA